MKSAVKHRGRFLCRNSKDGIPFRMTELFSGIGMQRMGAHLEDIPVEVVATSEIDPKASSTYTEIWGDDPNLGDIIRIDSLPETDILTYSFPCVSLSSINFGKGRKQGMQKGSETASSLLWEVQRLLEDYASKGNLPEWLVMENVPEVASGPNLAVFSNWIAYLNELGYTSRFANLNGYRFSTPQNRNRGFLLSHLGPDCPELPVGEVSGMTYSDIMQPESEVDQSYFYDHPKFKGKYRFRPINPVPLGRVTDRCYQLGVVDGMNNQQQHLRVYYEDGLVPTITTCPGGNSEPKFLHDGRIRRMTPKEMLRAQGQPEWAIDRVLENNSDSTAKRLAGNGLISPLFGKILRKIDDYDINSKEQ